MGFKCSNIKRWLAIFTILALTLNTSAELTTIALKAEAAVETIWVTVEATTRPTPTAPMDPSYTDTTILKKEMLEVSNEYRKLHDASPLKWNDTLAQYAQDWSEACIWKHSHGCYGENLAYGFGNLSAAVRAWGDEGELYKYDPPTGETEETGHFTQLVWRSTKQVGCFAYNCGYTTPGAKNADGDLRAQGWYLVCSYMPGGNIVTDDNRFYVKNVLPLNKKAAAALESSKTKTAATGNATNATTTGAQSSHTSGAGRNELGWAMAMTLVYLGIVGL